MKLLRYLAGMVLLLVLAASVLASWIAPADYATQFREAPNAPACRRFPLGTDELGRDRLSRVLYGTRVSLLLAPSAALLSTVLAALLGGVAGYAGGWLERVFLHVTDLFLSLPWLFLLLTVRAILPLNLPGWTSVSVTFALLGLLGWPAPARVVRAAVSSLRSSDFVLQARACGCFGFRLLLKHLVPNVRPVLLAQFCLAIPIFVLGEANLGLLGLGVSEPLPSWGNLLRGFENLSAVRENPWMAAPAVLLLLVTSCFHLTFPAEDHPS